MARSDHYDIAIVGGGIIGASLANRLAALNNSLNESAGSRKALRIALIDGKANEHGKPVNAPSATPISVQDFDLRVVALSAASQQFMQDMDVWSALQARACPYQEMEVWDEEGTGLIHFDCADVYEPALGYIVENRAVVGALYERLHQFSHVTVLASEVTDFSSQSVSLQNDSDAVESRLQLDGETNLYASLVVAADGARSPLRQWMEFSTREWDYDHTAIVATVKTSKPHQNTAWQCFSSNGPVAFLPLIDEHYCSVVWSLKTAVAEQKLMLDDEAFCQSITSALQSKLGAVVDVSPRLSFPLRQRHSKRYVKPGVVLLGDAAHTVHPLAGQGANLGLYDVEALAKEISRAVDRNLPMTDISILHRFERQRMPHNLMAMATMEGFKQLFGADNLALRWLRNTGMNILNQQPLIKNQLAKLASGKFV